MFGATSMNSHEVDVDESVANIVFPLTSCLQYIWGEERMPMYGLKREHICEFILNSNLTRNCL